MFSRECSNVSVVRLQEKSNQPQFHASATGSTRFTCAGYKISCVPRPALTAIIISRASSKPSQKIKFQNGCTSTGIPNREELPKGKPPQQDTCPPQSPVQLQNRPHDLLPEFCYLLVSVFQCVILKFLFLCTSQGEIRDKKRELKVLRGKIKNARKAYKILRQEAGRAESQALNLALRTDGFEAYRRRVSVELEATLLLITDYAAAVVELQAEVDAETQRHERRMAMLARTTGIVVVIGIRIAQKIFKSA